MTIPTPKTCDRCQVHLQVLLDELPHVISRIFNSFTHFLASLFSSCFSFLFYLSKIRLRHSPESTFRQPARCVQGEERRFSLVSTCFARFSLFMKKKRKDVSFLSRSASLSEFDLTSLSILNPRCTASSTTPSSTSLPNHPSRPLGCFLVFLQRKNHFYHCWLHQLTTLRPQSIETIVAMASAFRDTPIWVFLRWVLGSSLLRYPEEEDGAINRIQAAVEKWEHHLVDVSMDVGREEASQNAREKPCEFSNGTGASSRETDCSTPHPLIIVDWYDEKDPENPINWTGRKKSVVYIIVNFTACVVYMASAIYTPSQPLVQEVFGVSVIVASQGLGLFIVGYGVGPLIWSPLSEMPAVGRNLPYLVPLLTFVILSVPTALANSIGSLLVLRFLQGFFGSPVLSTGGASLSDIVDAYKRPYSLYTWAIFSFAGPSIGNVIAGFTVPKLGWRWSLWEILFTTSPALILQVNHSPPMTCAGETNKAIAFPTRDVAQYHPLLSSQANS